MSSTKKLILVIGATGAQGRAVIDALLSPAADGTTSPYAVRALTRNLESASAKELEAIPGVETFKGSFTDFDAVFKALEGCYGAYVNTDGFTEGEQTDYTDPRVVSEIYAGLRIFELAKQRGTLKHYVWSNLDYSHKKSGYNPKYRCEHYDGKGRVLEFLRSQSSDIDGMVWSSLTSGPYMEMLKSPMFGPSLRDDDGSFIFAAPMGTGHVTMIALKDLGYFARYIFDHREEYTGKDLEAASELVTWPNLVAAFKRVTGKPAKFIDAPLELWFQLLRDTDRPVANKLHESENAAQHTSWEKNFTAWWSQFHDGILARDMSYLKSIHPGLRSIEAWMIENQYDGSYKPVLKNSAEGKSVSFNAEGVSAVLAKLKAI
ncbi:NAD(P)-binding protein [Sistotremastrum suecicum HHB10207 ss-3]|uniref:NAD(P)-binding protein n=1 Tax=Sistotremastrum suecicum HHB10207 ss-3 TaxID=1314776 RepID=A0A165X6B4_9AGAM|nr:NAD(P)-binding protein [Sistotremastrum suecicum HHB10207 ss-3]